MSPPTIWWVRHGPTHAKAMIGWTDIKADLSDTAALARLSDFLPPDSPVVSSDLDRAVSTAQALPGGRPYKNADRRLREIHFGDWERQTADEADCPQLRAFWDRPGDVAAPNGESWNSFCARVSLAQADLLSVGPDVIVVAHMGTIMAAIQSATGCAPTEAFSHHIAPLSVTCIRGQTAGPIGLRL